MTDLKLDLIQWVLNQGIRGAAPQELFGGLCERLVTAGIPLLRGSVGSDVLHPELDSRGFRWVRGQEVVRQDLPRAVLEADDTNWRQSPFYRLITDGGRLLRRRIAVDYQMGEFPMLDEYKAKGATDYAAMALYYGEAATLGPVDGFIASWMTDAPAGFSDAHLDLLETVMPSLGLAMGADMAVSTALTLLNTYLGRDAARRVLRGEIVRGRAETIRAVIWNSDLTGFTRIADTVDRSELLELLNDYAEATVEVLDRHEGNVLKFIGDGILAIFPGDDLGAGGLRALDAARDVRQSIAKLNAKRSAAGLAVTDLYLALHVGELFYGNFGSRTRLDFTVLGPAVNEASRIAALSRQLDCNVIVSSAFAAALGDRRDRLVSLGRYALRGVTQPQELFTVDPTAQAA
jgi:adenylate cyclase